MSSNEAAGVRVAILGLGLMGAGMAHRLIAAGYTVSVYNRNSARTLPFEGKALIAGTPEEAARNRDVIISMVADDRASAAIWLGADGALRAVRPGTLCIESGTVSMEWIRQWGAGVAAAGGECVDAPVTGSRAQAETGELNFLAGGSPEAVARATPVLRAMGKSVVPLGPAGSGTMFKLINNFLCGVQLASIAEALVMIDRSGLDRDTALATLLAGAPASPLVKTLAGRMAGGDATLNFQLQLMAKDLDYATRTAAGMALDLVTAKAAHATIDAAAHAGFGEQDIAAVYQYLGGRGV